MFSDLITSKSRVKLLNVFLANPSEMYHVREFLRRTEDEINAVRRELLFLEKNGILTKEIRGNRVYYSLSKNYPFYFDLLRLGTKTVGLGHEILKNRAKIGKIKYAMFSGRFARGLKKVKPKPLYPIVIRRGGPKKKEAYGMLEKFAQKEGFDIHLMGSETPISVACKKMVELSYKFKIKN